MLHPSTQHHLCILQGLIVEQPVQCCPHLVRLPDAALLGGLLGGFHRDGAFDEDAPLHRQQKGIVQQLVDLMEGSAGEGALLLLGREVSPLAAHILSARGLAHARSASGV